MSAELVPHSISKTTSPSLINETITSKKKIKENTNFQSNYILAHDTGCTLSFLVPEGLLEYLWFPSTWRSTQPQQKFPLLQFHLFLPPLSHATFPTHERGGYIHVADLPGIWPSVAVFRSLCLSFNF